MAAILDAILNFGVTVACWKGVNPEFVAGGLGNPAIYNNLLQQTVSVFTKMVWFAPGYCHLFMIFAVRTV